MREEAALQLEGRRGRSLGRLDAGAELLELRRGEGRELDLRRARVLGVDHGQQQQLLRRVRAQAHAALQQRQQLRQPIGPALNEVGGAVSVPGQFSEGKSTWVAQLVSTIDALL